ncbi:hypothetical protein [Aquimarina sp. I32.4]|uniref:hypothetical protein n=1 Tax=Aquimarina sp. I32.4 TaxID=2053903 RepID=UPI000CDE673B|nr:hypothetical protein [Aquimarina sp. I32.4]
MTLKNNSFLSRITSTFLVLLLVLPIIIKATHKHKNEEHLNCKEKLTHLYESVGEHCDVCYFSFASFNLSSKSFVGILILITNKTIIDNYKSITLSFCHSSIKRLRAPPLIS